VADDPAEVLPAIAAATVVLVRDGANGLETLLLLRNSRGPFGGMWVFPGGRVDDADIDPTERGDILAAARRAAVREAAEEAGLAIDPASLVALAHWEPPAVHQKRFATWFFVAPCPPGAVTVDGAEIHDHAWMRPADALDDRDAGRLDLAPPTWVTLWQLSSHPTVSALLAAVASSSPERFSTHMARDGDVVVAMWHGDAGYDAVDVNAPGHRHRLRMTDGAWAYERTAARGDARR
jgi:8-oxo-dGTP pyrophosphatase MutT (NUDIX family)